MPGKANKKTNDKSLKHLDNFIRNNETIDFITVKPSALLDHPQVSWKGLSRHKEEVLQQFKAYRRLLKVMPEGTDHTIVMALLEAGIHSALQIAAIPRHRFVAQHLSLFGEDEASASTFHQHARAIRSRLLVQYMDRLQSNEPHLSTTRL